MITDKERLNFIAYSVYVIYKPQCRYEVTVRPLMVKAVTFHSIYVDYGNELREVEDGFYDCDRNFLLDIATKLNTLLQLH